MNFSASYMSVAWKRIFSWEYATVLEGLIRRTCLWMKQRENSIFFPLENSWRKCGLGAVNRTGKSRFNAGTSLSDMPAGDPDSPGTVFPTPLWKPLNSISSTPTLFWKALKGLSARDIKKRKPCPTWPYDREGAQVPLTCKWCCVHAVTRASRAVLSRVQGCQNLHSTALQQRTSLLATSQGFCADY